MAKTNLLSDKAVLAALKQAEDISKSVKKSDGAGLVLEARPTGSGWWRLRFMRDGKEGMLSLGTYPEVSLKLARERRDELRRQLAAGVDLSQQRKADKEERLRKQEAKALADAGKPGLGTFEHVAREWHATVHCAKVSEGHAARTLVRFEQFIFPWLGARTLDAIEAPDLLECLRRLTGRGAVETAHRTKDACGQVFRYGIASGYCKRNPAGDLRDALPPVQSRHFAAITKPDEAAALLRDVHSYPGRPVTRAALLLSAMLLLRPGELRAMRWDWIDVDAALLTVPGEVMKRSKSEKGNGVPHLVPLPRQALQVLEELRPLTGHRPFVFPSENAPMTRCMSENTVRSALRRMGYGNDDMTAHGFRAMARTMAAERLGAAPEVIEAQLAHTVPDALGRAYNRTQYIEQRTALMQQWADYLDRLRTGAEVIPLKRSA